jgi:hypothetical protein
LRGHERERAPGSRGAYTAWAQRLPEDLTAPERFDPRDRWLALATESFTRPLAPAELDELAALGRLIDRVRAGEMDDRLERLRRQLDAPRPGALHHKHPVAPDVDPDADGLVPCDLLACWFPRQE